MPPPQPLLSTALGLVVSKVYPTVVQLLLEAGADPNHLLEVGS